MKDFKTSVSPNNTILKNLEKNQKGFQDVP